MKTLKNEMDDILALFFFTYGVNYFCNSLKDGLLLIWEACK
jgi:hypothetical protein